MLLYCFAENWIQILCLKGYDCIIIGKLSIIDSIQYLSKKRTIFCYIILQQSKVSFSDRRFGITVQQKQYELMIEAMIQQLTL